jgi:hypothetical protein
VETLVIRISQPMIKAGTLPNAAKVYRYGPPVFLNLLATSAKARMSTNTISAHKKRAGRL